MLNKKLLFLAPLSNEKEPSKDGYINAAEGIKQILISLNLKDLKIINLSLPYNPEEIPDHQYEIAYLIINPFMFTQPGFQAIMKQMLGRVDKVFMQVVWELSDFPILWNWMWGYLGFTGFLTPSIFLENLIKKKTTKPVFRAPHFVNTDIFKPIDFDKKIKEDKFTVLHIGQWTERKGNRDALIAFVRALGDKEDCQLILKYTEMSKFEVDAEAEIRSITYRNTQDLKANIYTNIQNNTLSELVGLYNSASLLLFCSRGEGFGLPPAEVMACGIPVIYTDFSSMPEVCEAPGNVAISCIEDEAVGMSHFGYMKGSKYGVPKISDLITALEIKYQFWKNDRKAYYEQALKGRDVIIQRYGKKSIQEYMLNFINNA